MTLIEIIVKESKNGQYTRSVTLPILRKYTYDQCLQAIYCLEVKQVHKKESRGGENA